MPYSIQEISKNQRSYGGESATNAAGLSVPSRRNWSIRSSILASWDRLDSRPTCVRESSSSTADVVPVPGTYDFVITKDYCRNNTPPKVLAMVFVIDVSYNKVKSGLVHLLCAEFKNNIRHLPVDEGQERASIKVHEASSLTAPDGGRRRCPGNVHALLFTSCSGQRQLRVFNLSLKTCNQLADFFRSSDLDTTNLFFTKQGLFKLQDNKP
ncbi:protein transport protein Sec24C-like [Culex pipiens pallens]|uniref:protein transport protein Sec24C-like n=1 Tax=Culex pipiens pallens TaxID=42434 RepID=UPI0022A9FF34|nr:protein transport protein Sec24C-like [Culex pipiens pallens]